MNSLSSNNRTENDGAYNDLESNASKEQRKFTGKAWNAAARFSKGYVLPNTFKMIAILMTGVCIFQFIWIHRIQAGLIRVANDPFDNIFSEYEKIDRHSLKLWDNDRQSFIHNTLPVPVHSHNDYLRRIPLWEALGSGCISIEADVHLHNSDLLVGHDASHLHHESTLRSMYLDPLQRMLTLKNNDTASSDPPRGIFGQSPQQTITLLIDQKTADPATFTLLHSQLQPLRDLDYLTYWNGSVRITRPLTIVASGATPFDSILALNSSHRDIFFDAPLDALSSPTDDFSTFPPTYTFNVSNSYFASTQFSRMRLYSPASSPSFPRNASAQEKDEGLSQIKQAKARGLLARYWDTPARPQNLRDIVWRVLVDEEVGVVNMDDLGAVRGRARGWGRLELKK